MSVTANSASAQRNVNHKFILAGLVAKIMDVNILSIHMEGDDLVLRTYDDEGFPASRQVFNDEIELVDMIYNKITDRRKGWPPPPLGDILFQ